VSEALRNGGARSWQIALTAGPLAAALVEPAEDEVGTGASGAG
jgi:hypothetical protein